MTEPTKKQKNTAMFDAARLGKAREVIAAIKDGADIEARDKTSNYTPLMFMAIYGRLGTCKNMLKMGANLEAKTESGDTAFSLTVTMRQYDHCFKLFELKPDMNVSGTNDSPLHIAAFDGHAEACQKFIDAGADIEMMDKEGKTPLDLTVQTDSPEAGKVLLRAGAQLPSASQMVTQGGVTTPALQHTNQWLSQMRESAREVFSKAALEDDTYFTDGKINSHVLDACAADQFGPFIGERLIEAKQYTLFEKVWDALPERWRQENQGVYIEYAKHVQEITLPDITLPGQGRAL